jgi:transposase
MALQQDKSTLLSPNIITRRKAPTTAALLHGSIAPVLVFVRAGHRVGCGPSSSGWSTVPFKTKVACRQHERCLWSTSMAGLIQLATPSDDTRIAHPRLACKAVKRLRWLSRERGDRRRKDSVNRRRTVARLGRAHRALGDAHKDGMPKATPELVDTYAVFAVEDLSLRGMMRARMAGSLADAGLGEFARTRRYKAEWAGRSWHVHGRFVRSTGVRPDRTLVGGKRALSARSWVCDGCGTVHDRDVAAARMILSGAVTQALREPASDTKRKRGSAIRG